MIFKFDSEKKLFRIICGEAEYAFAVSENGTPVHLHFGAPLLSGSDYIPLLSNKDYMSPGERRCSHAEYSCGEAFDYGVPCLRARFADGAETLRLRYKSHAAADGILTVTLADSFYPLEVDLVYETWDSLPLIGRRAVIRNCGSEPATLLSALSASMNLPNIGSDNYRLTHYSGDWGMEYQRNRLMLSDSRIEISTSHFTEANMHKIPFFALDRNGGAAENYGEVWFGMLRWSGDFRIAVETIHAQNFRTVTVSGGVNDFTSQIALAAGESFETPEFVFGYSSRGFEHMSEILYDWQFEYTLPKGRTDKAHSVRPVIYNTWYPYEFDIDEQKLIDLIPKAKYIGAELYVIDDGWMKGRINDRCGLGDWVIDEARFPRGLGCIADEVHRAGMKFGIWVEPEMVNPDSGLYRAHSDWVLSEPNRSRTLQRSQLILDMSRDEIRDWAIEWLDRLITEAKLDYLKWDMNREAAEIGLNALERGAAVKYMRNIEYIWRHLNESFPDLLIENCASGGGRADFGLGRYADRVNRSDNADPIDVMLLHEGYSTFFVPKLAGGAGNVSPEFSHVNGRRIPLDFRVNSGMTGSMSVGVNLLKCGDGILESLKEAVAKFKILRPALQDSYVYRIASAYEHPYAVFEYAKRGGSEFTVFAFGHGMRHMDKQLPFFRMRGLDANAVYECGEMRMSGAALMNLGISISLRGDYSSSVMTWKRIQ